MSDKLESEVIYGSDPEQDYRDFVMLFAALAWLVKQNGGQVSIPIDFMNEQMVAYQKAERGWIDRVRDKEQVVDFRIVAADQYKFGDDIPEIN